MNGFVQLDDLAFRLCELLASSCADCQLGPSSSVLLDLSQGARQLGSLRGANVRGTFLYWRFIVVWKRLSFTPYWYLEEVRPLGHGGHAAHYSPQNDHAQHG